jgi:hypothetical protein
MRFTIRKLMVAVAIASGILAAGRLIQRSHSYASTAQFHGQEERNALLVYRAVEASYLRRCRRLEACGVALSRAQIDLGLEEAKALWPIIREKRDRDRYIASILGESNDSSLHHVWNLGTQSVGVPDEETLFLAWKLGTQSELASHHSRMRQVYERAARYPWLPVEP